MSSISLLLLLLLCICAAATDRHAAASPSAQRSAYEVLESYNLPRGVLPEGIVGYEFDQATGKFSAHLNRSCRYTIEKYKFRDKTTISGILSRDKLLEMEGIKIKLFFFFWRSPEVTRRGDRLRFVVGYFAVSFSPDSFKLSPQCG